MIFLNVVGVAQLVERQTVALNVAGSNPVAHPKKIANKSEINIFHKV
jgi:hypothetical protein